MAVFFKQQKKSVLVLFLYICAQSNAMVASDTGNGSWRKTAQDKVVLGLGYVVIGALGGIGIGAATYFMRYALSDTVALEELAVKKRQVAVLEFNAAHAKDSTNQFELHNAYNFAILYDTRLKECAQKSQPDELCEELNRAATENLKHVFVLQRLQHEKINDKNN